MNHELNKIIENILEGKSLKLLSEEREKLTGKYRRRDPELKLGDDQKLAYLATRLPATYAVVCKVLRELLLRSGAKIHSLLDIGAGPGSVLLGAADILTSLREATMLEQDPKFISFGKQLTENLKNINKNWMHQDILKPWAVQPHDLVTASYCLNELSELNQLSLLEKLWDLSKKFLVIIEPGSKSAFETLKKMRAKLLSLGGYLIAPCPHSAACPLPQNDWCHFHSRVERSSVHRKLKDATLNYEDEKFSYLIFSKIKINPCRSRILRRPEKSTGFIKLQVCSDNHKIENKIITKKNKKQYTCSKKLKCGDEYIDCKL